MRLIWRNRRKVLGYSFWGAPRKVVKRRVSKKTIKAMQDRVRVITQCNRGRNIGQVFAELRSYLVGGRELYRLADTPRIFRELDEWIITHRRRALLLKQWTRGSTIYRELRPRGISHNSSAQVAASARRWWHNSAMLVHVALPNTYFD